MPSSLLLLLAMLQAPAAAQNLPLTNCGVLALLEFREESDVKAEIRESVPMFDLSPEGLSSLTDQGVPEEVIEVMQAAQQESPETHGQSLSGLPCDPGLYFKSDTGWMRADPFQNPKLKSKRLWTFLSMGLVSKVERQWPGLQAQTAIAHTQPTLFEVSKGSVNHPGGGWPMKGMTRIIRLKSAKGKRTATCTIRNRVNFWPDCPNCSFGKSRAFASFTQISQRVRMITPLSKLEPGEYWLHRCSTEQSGPLSDALFGIRVGEHIEAKVEFGKPIKKE